MTVLSTTNGALGEILVSAGGRTLYHDSAEQRGVVRCVGACAVKWPPLVISARARPFGGRGVTESLLGTVRRPDGRVQVTYRGLPLYMYSGDARAGQVNGQGVGGSWHALTPAGTVVTTKAPGTGSMGTIPTVTTTMTPGPGPGVNPGMFCAANPQSCVNGQPVTH